MRFISFSLFIVYLYLVGVTANAHVCQNIFKSNKSFLSDFNFWNKKISNKFNEEEIQLLQKIIQAEDKIFIKPNYLSFNKNGGYDPFFVFIWDQLPEDSKKIISKFAFNLKIQSKQKMLNDLYKQLHNLKIESYSQKSVFLFILESWISHCESNTTDFAGWLEKQLTTHSKQSKSDLQIWKDNLENAYEQTFANEYWRNLGVEILPLQILDKTRFEFNLNQQIIRGQIDQKKSRVILEVPRELIKTAAWNPISMNEISNKIQTNQKSPDVYPAFLASNKYFYLLDGNHRFLIDPKSIIKIELSYPLKTSSWSNTFDALGITQPTQDEILKLYKNELDAVGFIKAKISGISSSVDELNRD